MSQFQVGKSLALKMSIEQRAYLAEVSRVLGIELTASEVTTAVMLKASDWEPSKCANLIAHQRSYYARKV